MAHEPVELHERAGVEQLFEPLVREQLPLASVLLDRLLRALVRGLLAQAVQLSSLPWVDSVRSSVAATRVSLTRVAPMLDRSTIWPYEDGEPGEFYYQRYAHPAGVEAERKLGELEGGHALLFPSGSGATTALLLTFLETGRTVAMAKDAYYGTRS